MKKVIILNGMPRSGKNTFIDLLRDISDIPVFEYSSVDKIKRIAKDSFGWDGEKDPIGRRLLAELKDAATNYNNLPFKSIKDERDRIALINNEFILCVCVREPQEIKKLIDHYDNPISVCIRRDSVENKDQSNKPDSGIFDYIYDYYVINDAEGEGWEEEFKYNIKTFYEGIVKE